MSVLGLDVQIRAQRIIIIIFPAPLLRIGLGLRSRPVGPLHMRDATVRSIEIPGAVYVFSVFCVITIT